MSETEKVITVVTSKIALRPIWNNYPGSEYQINLEDKLLHIPILCKTCCAYVGVRIEFRYILFILLFRIQIVNFEVTLLIDSKLFNDQL